MLPSFLSLLFLVSPLFSLPIPFRFPHGYFNDKYLQPFEAIYLNMMAQSNLEYGGVTLEELAALEQSRKKVSYEEYLAMKDGKKEKKTERVLEDKKIEDEVKEKSGGGRRVLDDPIEDNPFEDIPTRAPPSSPSHPLPIKLPPSLSSLFSRRPPSIFDLSQPLPQIPRNEVFVPLSREDLVMKKEGKSWIEVAREEIEMRERREGEGNGGNKERGGKRPLVHPSRRMNNPFSRIDISKPTIVHLPIPPELH